jgi:hypothetical protein
MSTPITFGPGITLGAGIIVGQTPTAGIDGSVGPNEIGVPVHPSGQLEDGSATVNDPIGFTINNDSYTGVAIPYLSASNQAFFATYGTGTKTVYWGPGSTVPFSSVSLSDNSGNGTITFYILGQTGPATYNYPFTFII